MSIDVKRYQSLVAAASALNDTKLDHFTLARVQEIVNEAVGAEQDLTVDEGGGLHEPSGLRIGAIRRAPSGEWIIDGQNVDALNADAPIPGSPSEADEPEEGGAQR